VPRTAHGSSSTRSAPATAGGPAGISRMGLTPYERLRTCHVAANAVEEVYGVSAFDLVAGFVGEAV
jgi:hypothetical protein